MARHTFLAATAAAGVLLTGGFAGAASEEVDTGIHAHQLLGARYETMLALASYLDRTAQGALEGAEDEVRRGSPEGARFLSAVRSFAGSTRDLERAMRDRQATSVELPAQVADLTEHARLLNGRMRSAGVLASTYDEWEAVADVLRRMTRLLAGYPVEVPTAYVVPALSGPRLAQLRQLAADLRVSATRAHDKATRAVTDYRARGEQFLGELRHFAGQSRDLHVQAHAGPVDPQTVGPVVDLLLEEARQADRRMRDAEVFKEVWDDSGRTITILQSMASLLRS
ncbi:MAG TPA: hypothetical protein VMT87_07590 [Vicinamibacteria bacterium]|nr:hypothetical protein [Vicinamibacteria bacterium]